MDTSKNSTTEVLLSTGSSQRIRTVQMVENFHVVWLDRNIDETNDGDQNCITKLQQVVNTVNTFVDVDECINFIDNIKEDKAFVILSGALGQTIVPMIHDKPQINTIYIFCDNTAYHRKLVKKWRKVAGAYTDIVSICEALKQDTQDCDHNSVSISFAKITNGAINSNHDDLDSSFVYTQVFKEILLTIDFGEEHVKEFLKYCREQLAGNDVELKSIDMMEKDYRRHQPIWWYTYECFLHSMLNRALCLEDVELIIAMGFFVRDLHQNIAKLHSEQYGRRHHSNSFMVYRGQGLSKADFDQLQITQGGLLTFNNFLSTSMDHRMPLEFARRTIKTSDKIGVLFVMTIDPSISATPFASIKNISYLQREDEILFSMYSVFRIGQVTQIEEKNSNRLWQVQLTLTSDHDPRLLELTHSLQENTAGPIGWFRLGRLMMAISQYDMAQQLFEMILDQTTDRRERGEIYYQLGCINRQQGKHMGAIAYSEKCLKIRQKTLPANHPDLATSYKSIALVYCNMGQYLKALSYFEKAHEILSEAVPTNHLDLALSYHNLGTVYDKMGEYPKALLHFEKALKIRQKTLPLNDPLLAASYNNTGLVYYNMGEHSKALSYFEEALKIRQKILPANYPDLATSYNNIGFAYYDMGDFSKALSYFEKVLEIRQKILPEDHLDLGASYNNIGEIHRNMGKYSEALLYYKKALAIWEETLAANHSDLGGCYNNIGMVHYNKGEYSNALSNLERASDIWQQSLSPSDPQLKRVQKNIEAVKRTRSQKDLLLKK